MAGFTVENLTFAYPGGIPALDGVSLTIGRGEFVVLCGHSGCGKTTLLRHFKTVLTPAGERSGRVLFGGVNLDEIPNSEQAAKIGYVLQSPEDQIVTDKVWHELAFGLESLGVPQEAMRLRVGEMASFFGIDSWFRKPVDELSGGQKQMLNLASVMAMQPSVLVLDEPTAQLDPIAASEFLAAVHKINRELGVTVILSEHRLEEVFPVADRAVVMDGGKIIMNDRPAAVGKALCGMPGDVFLSAPAPMRIHAKAGGGGECPMTVRDGRQWLDTVYTGTPAIETKSVREEKREPLIELRDCWFRYGRGLPDVIRDLSVKIVPGEVFAVVGSNGAGKSTALGLLAGLRVPYRGRVRYGGRDIKRSRPARISGDTAMLPQDPQTLFAHITVLDELLEMDSEAKARAMADMLELTPLLSRHPYDLSGGEQQRVAIAKVLMTKPRLLLLDEPTKGLDPAFKPRLAAILRACADKGAAVVMVSHDVEFCAGFADRCALFFDGAILADNSARAFFAGNAFYTTAANRMARHVDPNAVTDGDVVRLIKGDAV